MVILPVVSPAQLLLRLEASGISETRTVSNLTLYAPARGTPSPFLPPGPFSAEWTGGLALDLRGDFQFQAKTTANFILEINGARVIPPLDGTDTNDWSRPVRLRKGTNLLRATLHRHQDTEAQLQLSWRGRGVPPSPLPSASLVPTHAVSIPSTHGAAALNRGRDLFLIYRCGQCHEPETSSPLPEFRAEAPSFHGIGSRLRQGWMARWIADPRALQPNSRMPAVLHAPSATTEASAIAQWLSSLIAPASSAAPAAAANTAVGRELYEMLLCRSCHGIPGQAVPPDAISLNRIGEKFIGPLALTEFLESPERNAPWSRMPNFQLSRDEAAHLAAFLLAQFPAGPQSVSPPDETSLRLGERLANDRGCFQCHLNPQASSRSEALGSVPSLRKLTESEALSGCLSSSNSDNRSPRFHLAPEEVLALRQFLNAGADSLGRAVDSDFAERWRRELRCHACHDTVAELPRLARIGEKLRPEWLKRLFSGKLSDKPRSWLASRMPAFPAYASSLAAGLAAIDGLPAHSPPEPPPDSAAADVGRKLVSASSGFACVTCHAIGPFRTSTVFEAPGVNLAQATDRLHRDYFTRWVRNPQSFDPTTKMPLYFDEEGNSALSDYFGGDGPKTLHALWEYLRTAPNILPPAP